MKRSLLLLAIGAFALGVPAVSQSGAVVSLLLIGLSGSVGSTDDRFDVRALSVDYGGDEKLKRSLELREVSSTALAAADFDEDGTPDLICGYAGSPGGLPGYPRADRPQLRRLS